MDRDASRLSRVETEVEGIKDELGVVDRRLSAHGSEIDRLTERQNEMSLDLLAIRKDTESISSGVQRVEKTVSKTADKLDALREQKIDDHLRKPLAKYEKVAWAILLGVVAFILGILLSTLFPGIG